MTKDDSYLYDTRHLMTMDELREARPDIFREPDSRGRASAASIGWLFQGVPEEGLMFSEMISFDGGPLPCGQRAPVAMLVVVDDLGRRTPPRLAALWTRELGWVLPGQWLDGEAGSGSEWDDRQDDVDVLVGIEERLEALERGQAEVLALLRELLKSR